MEHANVNELIICLQICRDFEAKILNWQEYQAKIKAMEISQETLTEVAAIFDRRRQTT